MNADTEKHTRGQDAGVTRHSISGDEGASGSSVVSRAFGSPGGVCDVNRTAPGANVCWVTAGRRETRLV